MPTSNGNPKITTFYVREDDGRIVGPMIAAEVIRRRPISEAEWQHFERLQADKELRLRQEAGQ